MGFAEELNRELLALRGELVEHEALLDRFTAEVESGCRLARARPDQQAEWERLLFQAVATVKYAIGGGDGVAEAVRAGEVLLDPIRSAAPPPPR